MRLALAFWLVTAALAAADPTVHVVPGGQYYHRAGHLVDDEASVLALDRALADGLAPCPECDPPHRASGAVVVPVESPYFRKLQAQRTAGRAYEGVRTPVTIQPSFAPDAPPAEKQKAPAVQPAQRFELPEDGIPVPGTGGLLKVPTFKGSNAIIAVPLPYGGYTVVQPPLISGSPAQPAAGPEPSGR